MNRKNIKSNNNRIISYVFLAAVFVLFLGIVLRIFTRTVLVSRLKINNRFTDIVFFDSKGLSDTDSVSEIYVAWDEMYPVGQESEYLPENASSGEKGLYTRVSERITGLVSSAEAKINDFTTAYLPGYNGYVYMANKYRKAIGWNFVSYSEYNGIIELKDGYLSTVNEKKNIDKPAESVMSLNDFCRSQGISFTYVPVPEKICVLEDSEYTGSVDYSNDNLDAMIKTLSDSGVDTLDLREALHNLGLNHHARYFRTDHHWTPETGVWAQSVILEYLEAGSMKGKIGTVHHNDEFAATLYKEWFLGSQGKKVTLANTEPDDISLLLPEFDTKLTIEIPSLGIKETGDFEVTYDFDQIEVRDYNKKSPYHAYGYGDRALIRITNELNETDGKVLIIRDSFGDVLVPFMSLSVAETVAIDPRYFTGSIEKLIESESPDAVILLYGAGEIADPDYRIRTSLWDLR